MLKVLVLGANGFIGRNLVNELLKKEIRVTGFGRNADFRFNPKARFIQGSFEEDNALRKALADQDIVYHLISQTIPSSSWDNPLLEIEKNLKPSLRLIELAAESGVKKICFASSGGTVYGFQESVLGEEATTEPFSPYGIVKRTIESFLQYAKVRREIAYDIYRITNVYGEGQITEKGLGFINTALENAINSRPISVFGDGEIVRDYIYVKDVAKALASSTLRSLESSNIFNLSSNCPISLNDLIVLIKDVLGVDLEVRYLPGRLNDNRTVKIDNSKILRYCSGLSLTPLEDGIRITHNFLKKRLAHVKKSV